MEDPKDQIRLLETIRGKLTADRQSLVIGCDEAGAYLVHVDKLVQQQLRIEAIDRIIVAETSNM